MGLGRVDVVHDAADDLAHFGLQQHHLTAGETGVDELAKLPVARGIGEDQVALLNGLRLGRVGMVMPFVDVKVSGWPETKRMSSYLVKPRSSSRRSTRRALCCEVPDSRVGVASVEVRRVQGNCSSGHRMPSWTQSFSDKYAEMYVYIVYRRSRECQRSIAGKNDAIVVDGVDFAGVHKVWKCLFSNRIDSTAAVRKAGVMAGSRSLIDTYGHYIDGQWVEADSGRYDVVNPATEKVIGTAPDASVGRSRKRSPRRGTHSTPGRGQRPSPRNGPVACNSSAMRCWPGAKRSTPWRRPNGVVRQTSG